MTGVEGLMTGAACCLPDDHPVFELPQISVRPPGVTYAAGAAKAAFPEYLPANDRGHGEDRL